MAKTEVLEHIASSTLSPNSKLAGFMGVLFDSKPDTIIKNMVALEGQAQTREAENLSKKPRKPNGLNPTENALFDMLWESTGCAMMDSGGAYGRMWQVNRKIKDFRKNEPVTVKDEGYGLEINLDIFHYLNERLEYDPTMSAIFTRYNKKHKDGSDWGNMSEFAEKYHIDDESESMPKIIEGNSYNEENALSQTIQYACFHHDGEYFVILQIHGGADVRGGYTDPKVFTVGNYIDDLYRLFDWCRIDGSCDCSDMNTDDLYHWYDTDLIDSKQWNYSKKHEAFYCKDCHSKINWRC